MDRDFNKLSLGTENGFLWDVNPASNELLREDGLPEDNTSEVRIPNDAFSTWFDFFVKKGDAWIKGIWERNFQIRGSGYLERNHSSLDFALHQDVRAKTLKGEWAGFMSATTA